MHSKPNDSLRVAQVILRGEIGFFGPTGRVPASASARPTLGSVLIHPIGDAMRTFENHIEPTEAWQAVVTLRGHANELDDGAFDDHFINQMRTVVDVFGARLERVDPDLISNTKLTQLAKAANQLIASLDQYKTADDAQKGTIHNSAQSQLDTLTDHIVQIASPPDETTADAARTARDQLARLSAEVDELRGTIGELERDARDRVEDVKSGDLAKVVADVNRIQSEKDTLAQQVSEFLTNSTSEATTARSAERSEFDAKLAEFRSEWDGEVSGIRTTFEDLATELRETAESTENERRKAASSTLAHMKAQRAEVDTLVEAIGRTAVTGGFGEWEAEERTAATRFRWITVAVVVAGAALWLIVDANDWLTTENEWASRLSHLAFFGVIFGFAGYTSRESAKHRRNANYARRMGIDLAALGPFIAKLPEQTRDELLTAFTQRVFGQASIAADIDAADGTDGMRPWGSIRSLGRSSDE